MPKRTPKAKATSESWIKLGWMARVGYEKAKLAGSIRKAEDEGDVESGGWYEMRGAFATLLWVSGEWPGPLAPDHASEREAEGEFQERITRYSAQFQAEEPDEADGP